MLAFFTWDNSSLDKGTIPDDKDGMNWTFATITPENDVEPTLSRGVDNFLVKKLHVLPESKKGYIVGG